MPNFDEEFLEQNQHNYIARILREKFLRPCDLIALEEYKNQLEREIELLIYKKKELKLVKKKSGAE